MLIETPHLLFFLFCAAQELEDAPCDSGNGSSLVQASVDIPPSPNHDAAIVQPSASGEHICTL